ncbi:GNAT family N-acetyltransferase [Anaerobacillus isosaccharinicus]|uniref:GNAT family N-acetyltransferase n=1 Tax=Anaerobacillus isosaccharinicus TaxID=1532552 RepID=A0A1S2MGB7_9BACI|nr:GNAT family N-acetyltransferase [Anaerobacillus isosaccharinicus]MBA5587114.1 GNAT family N-acetyltransferase [Anaerobacillus isosaccharinicus]QOY34690.1 GNAT family N-acetyltransferase [Anaerobacillus isosaccharinicus]
MGAIKPRHYKMKNGETILLRTAFVHDAENLLNFNKEIIKEAPYLLTTEEEFTLTLEQENQFLKQMIDDSGKLAIIAEYQNEIIGFLDFHSGFKQRIKHQGSFGMSVSNQFRSQGVGIALLTTLLDWGKEHPIIEKICLEVFSDNESAISLYKKFGFVEEGKRVKAIKISNENYYDLIEMAFFTK